MNEVLVKIFIKKATKSRANSSHTLFIMPRCPSETTQYRVKRDKYKVMIRKRVIHNPVDSSAGSLDDVILGSRIAFVARVRLHRL